MSSFTTRMKVYREKLHISQSELADKVGVRRETIVRLEKGQYNPSLKLALDISREFHAAIEDVFLFEERKNERFRTVYIVSADTHQEANGAEIELFGVYDNREGAEREAQKIRSIGYHPQIDVMPINVAGRTYLGGYYE